MNKTCDFCPWQWVHDGNSIEVMSFLVAWRSSWWSWRSQWPWWLGWRSAHPYTWLRTLLPGPVTSVLVASTGHDPFFVWDGFILKVVTCCSQFTFVSKGGHQILLYEQNFCQKKSYGLSMSICGCLCLCAFISTQVCGYTSWAMEQWIYFTFFQMRQSFAGWVPWYPKHDAIRSFLQRIYLSYHFQEWIHPLFLGSWSLNNAFLDSPVSESNASCHPIWENQLLWVAMISCHQIEIIHDPNIFLN